MSEQPFSLEFIARYIDRFTQSGLVTELDHPEGGPRMPLTGAENGGASAGYVRLWQGSEASLLDRMIHMRLIAGPVETQLLFVFGRADTSMPHLHAQVVQFPPDGCVYNMDYLPRLDPVDHPHWFARVFDALRRPYRRATADAANSCAQAPANPALAIYLSPWGIASGRATRKELDKLTSELDAYVDHYLELATSADWQVADPAAQASRDARHLALFFADELDPRAWNGVYRVVGEAAGRSIKALFQTPLRTGQSA